MIGISKRASVCAPTTRRGRRPWHVRTLFALAREPGDHAVGQQGTFEALTAAGTAFMGAAAAWGYTDKPKV
jgi:hypothetical protein